MFCEIWFLTQFFQSFFAFLFFLKWIRYSGSGSGGVGISGCGSTIIGVSGIVGTSSSPGGGGLSPGSSPVRTSSTGAYSTGASVGATSN